MKEILCFGDSNTFGLVPGKKQRYERGVRWTSRLEEALEPYGYRVAEEGLCGRTSKFDDAARPGRNGIKVLPFLLETHQPLDRVIVMLGTNDCKSAYHATAEDIGHGIEALLEQIRQANPSIKILLISPIWLADGVGEEGFDPEFDENSVAVSHQLKGVYQRIARRYHADFLAASDYVQPSQADREHMDAAAHRIFAEVVQKKVLESDVFFSKKAV
ncbi:MAG: GDSL-type esterase/lipase family protein [Lachnospiraceae bacterium]